MPQFNIYSYTNTNIKKWQYVTNISAENEELARLEAQRELNLPPQQISAEEVPQTNEPREVWHMTINGPRTATHA